MVVYNFNKDIVSIDRLFSEIGTSGISSATYQYTNYTSPNLKIYFDGSLSSEDQATLSGIIDSHTGLPIYESEDSFIVANGSGGIKFISVDSVSSTISGGLYSFVNDYFQDIPFSTVENIIDAVASGVNSSVVFGSSYHYEEVDAVSSTNSTEYLTKVLLETTSVPAGTYRLGWYYEWARDRTSTDFMATVTINDTTVMVHNQEPKDANDWYPASGYKHIELTEGAYNVSLKYCGEVGGNATSFIRRARVEFWRTA